MNIEELNFSIRRIKQLNGELLTNCFEPLSSFVGVNDAIETEHSLLVIRHEYKVERLFFYTKEFSDFGKAVESLRTGTYYLDVVSKSPEYICRNLEELGFRCIGRMKRMSCSDISNVLRNDSLKKNFFDNTIIQAAELSDAKEIYQVLWSVFDTGISHLPDMTELEKMISDNQIFIYRENGIITALLQEKVQPKKYYINQIYNNSEKKIVHALLLNRLSVYANNGGRYAFSWVEQNNIASMKFHRKFGFEHDGLWNIVYRLDKRQ